MRCYSHIRSWSRILGLLAAAMVPAGCDDDGGTGTGSGVPRIDLENAWPNEDGRRWSYLITTRIWDGAVIDSTRLYDEEGSVPPAPDVSEILPLLDTPVLPDSFDVDLSEWHLYFDGETTTQTGVTAQNLVEEPGSGGPLALVALARPDLVPRFTALGLLPDDFAGLVPMSAADTTFDQVPSGPLFLHGGAWEKTPEHIGTYGDAHAELAWLFLEDELGSGRRFSHQILPGLADEVVLHGLVRGTGPLTTPVGVLDNVVEVAYLLDFGILSASSVFQPELEGYYRLIAYGNVLYAPTVGPVASYERSLVPVGETLGSGAWELELELTGVRAGPEY